ncbi:MAG: ribosome maturation factor RimP [Pseudomonadota bacterium]|nr:ribosome maturation factor RimP [Pseudomonadota bacterium]
MSHIRSLIDSLRALAEPVAERQGCDLVAIELVGGAAGKRVLRVSLDKVGGATISDCTQVSRALSPVLDAEDLIASAYDLEVSTPGMERPLQREKDFAYFAGCDARIKLYGMDGRRRLKVRLLGAADGTVRVKVDDEGERLIPLADIERANLILDLEQFARLGQGLHPVNQPEAEGEAP